MIDLSGHEKVRRWNCLYRALAGCRRSRAGCHSPLSRHPARLDQQNYPEKQYFSKVWNADVVTNVTQPTLTVFKPSPELKNGTAIVICPGGGFMALSIASEGTDVAKYLAAKGVTAFVLKYRVAHTGEDATQEFATLFADKQKFGETVKTVEPLAIADGLAAVTYVRQHASEWGISPDRVGIIGFSAGGLVTAEVAVHYSPEGRPAFVAPIYSGGLVERRSRPIRRTAHVYCGSYRRFTRARATKRCHLSEVDGR